MIAGPDAGVTFSLDRDETIIGRGANATVILDDPSVSRQHARISRDDRAHHFIEDLGSANGTFVDGRRIRRAALSPGDRVQLGRDSVFRFDVVDREEEDIQRRLYQASMVDGLTELPNRRSLLERLASQIASARRTGVNIGVLMIDLDHFKEINDTHGHLAGDTVLREAAQLGAKIVRAGDVFARYGGEEFIVVGRLDKDDAMALAERLRVAIMEMQVDVGTATVGLTASIGLAVLSECGQKDDGTQLLGLADSRLYLAKISGRNRSCGDG
jgi:diguanylate cyclase (GGDEF)-like protein